MLFQICQFFPISFPVLPTVLLDLADIYRPNRKNIYPCMSLVYIILANCQGFGTVFIATNTVDSDSLLAVTLNNLIYNGQV